MARHVVKSGSVSLTIQPWKHPSGRNYWRASYYDSTGKERFITRADLKEAKAKVFEKAQELAKGTMDFNLLAPHQIRGIKRILEADPQLRHVDEFLAWKAKETKSIPVSQAVDEFLSIKTANRGRSTQNVKTLRKHLVPLKAAFPDWSLNDVTTPELETFLLGPKGKNSNRTRRNIRGSLVTFFRWCVKVEYLPEGKTAAEKLERPLVPKKVPLTWSPDQMRSHLRNVQPKYLPWLASTGFGGFRSDEIYPLAGGDKSPLDWSDFKWDRNLIVVRPETDKNGNRRVVEILPVLRAWLYPIRQESGPVGIMPPPHKLGRGKDAIAETKRLGQLVGGWKVNALRHSWISYRVAHVGFSQTATEAGNSEPEIKASYNDAKGSDEADEWFDLTPENVLNCSEWAAIRETFTRGQIP